MVDLLGSWLVKVIGNRPTRIKQFTLIAPSILSSFISNTAATAFFMPIVLGLSRRSQVSPSKLLMPLAFAAILSRLGDTRWDFHQSGRQWVDATIRLGTDGHL
ncbi:MAG UNVERIFIED_CONTAM: hypothetical protein LVT10_17420 [Anaerolineae bacterium]|jgi:di/tricarboxylate transporter